MSGAPCGELAPGLLKRPRRVLVDLPVVGEALFQARRVAGLSGDLDLAGAGLERQQSEAARALVGSSEAIVKIRETLPTYANSDEAVLIESEEGNGSTFYFSLKSDGTDQWT